MSRVRRFHWAFGLEAPKVPTIPSRDLAALRVRLITEESKEVAEEAQTLLGLLRAGKAPDEVIPVLQRFVKEVCDLRYVCEGALVSLGVEPDAYDEVHRSNMSKLGADGKPIYDAGGKVLKGPGYSPADPDKMFPGVYDHEEDLP